MSKIKELHGHIDDLMDDLIKADEGVGALISKPAKKKKFSLEEYEQRVHKK